MDKKQFIKGSVFRFAIFLVVFIAVLVVKLADLAPADWWGWYLLYALVFLSLAYFAYFAVKYGKGFIIESLRVKMMKQTAQDFVDRWDDENYEPNNVLNYAYQSERDFDTTLAFHDEDIAITHILRDENGDVTGDNETSIYGYDKIKSLAVIDIGGQGCAHIRFSFDDGAIKYAYFDVDLAKFLKQKTNLPLENIEQLKEYYDGLLEEKKGK